MRSWAMNLGRALLAGCVIAGAAPPLGAEVVEEIVAVINGGIVTKSAFEEQEQSMISEAYRQYTGAELDEKVALIRKTLLLDMIDNHILYDRGHIFDLEKVSESYFQSFKEQQQLEDDADVERMLASQGMTVEELKERLMMMFVPRQILNMEVNSRVSVADAEVEAYYDENPDQFMVEAQVTLREIVLLAEDPATKERRRGEMEAVLQEVLDREDFAAVASEHSEAGTKENGGLLGPLERGELSAELEKLAFSLPLEEVSGILEMPYGFHIIQVVSRSESAPRPLEEVKEQLRTFLENKKYVVEYDAFMKRARSEAEWCVKPQYRDRIPSDIPVELCKI